VTERRSKRPGPASPRTRGPKVDSKRAAGPARREEKPAQPERCREILRRLCAEAGKRESSPFCREVASHLKSCASCRAQAATLRGTLELYWCLEGREVPRAVAARLRKSLGLPKIACK